ncbi:hypothetical protein RGQ13_00775 [Thalassotalea psychrophila]|uniref:Transglutaminase-like domain-containing protein n=1 Tax=Thalassotalea psychrophila TaxID=3065647 RepID=A0ABY9TUN3_9GAMM|nr:hypothetical protein RGQ13_00775 [Colwelliaceae bacterium SQ149]
MMKKVNLAFTIAAFLISLILISINIYGLFQDIRPKVFFSDQLRFKQNDISLSYKQTINNIARNQNENDQQYAQKITPVIAQGVAHIHWKKFENTKFNQLIPVWENYILFLMGKFSGIPEYEKYHYSDYHRSLKRGIGICGDASMIMSQILDEHNIHNQLLSFPGHVIVSAKFKDGQEYLFDPDFGVYLPYSAEEISQNSSLVISHYKNAGYSNDDLKALTRIYSNNFERWNGVQHFVTKKYYFEYFSYFFIWAFPCLLLLVSAYLLYIRKKRSNS